LATCQRKYHVLKQELIDQQKALEEALTKAIETKKKSLNSMEDT
jgi:hypothetical protein